MNLKIFWQKWLKIAETIGNFNARAVLTLLYFALFSLPSFFLTYIFDKVGKKLEDGSYYIDETTRLDNIEDAKEM